MDADDPPRSPDDSEDPVAERLAGEILDGKSVSWDAIITRAETLDPDLARQLRFLAEVAAVHRPATTVSAPTIEGRDAPLLQPHDDRRWGPLTLVEKIGAGAFGEVFRAWDHRLDREVALKLLRRREVLSDDDMASIEEGRLLARVRHPNVVTVYGAERIDGRAGIWMEFVHGATLAQLVDKHGPFTADDATTIGIDLCGALAAVHDADLLHRDIKPQNVMRDPSGRVVLMDFGTVHDSGDDTTGSGNIAGTPVYMAPELFRGGSPTIASDLYSTAALLFRILTARYPVAGRTIDDVKAAHEAGHRVHVNDVRPDLPAPLVAVVERGLSTDPTERPASAREFAAALAAARASGEVPRPRALLRFIRERPGQSLAAGLLVATLTLTTMWRLHVFGAGDRATGRGVPQLVCRDCVGNFFSISRDGRFAVLRLDDSGDLAVRDLSTLAMTRLFTKQGHWETSGYADRSAISRDSNRVAYRWFERSGANPELRFIERRPAAKPVVLVAPSPDTWEVEPNDWRPDSSEVLVTIHRTNPNVWELAWVAAAGGRTIVRASSVADAKPYNSPRLSPDGRQIVYVSARGTPCGSSESRLAANESHLCLLPADDAGANARTLVATSADNRDPVWAPDGTSVLFTSDVGGRYDLWSVPVRNGEVAGSPTVVVRDIGPISARTVTQDGRYYYSKVTLPVDRVLVASVRSEADGSMAIGPPSAIVGMNPSWSADRRSIALMRRLPSGEYALVVSSIDGRDEQVYAHPSLRSNLVLFLRDGQAVLVAGRRPDQSPVIYRVDLKSREFREIVTDQAAKIIQMGSAAVLSPDDKTIYFASGVDPKQTYKLDRILALDLVSGQARVVTELAGDVQMWPSVFAAQAGMAVSPDGRRVALLVSGQRQQNRTQLLIVSSRGENPSTLAELSSRFYPFSHVVAWTTDDTVWVSTNVGIQRIAATGRMGLPVQPAVIGQYAAVSVSPDGSQIAWRPSETSLHPELWTLDIASVTRASK